MTPRQAEMIRPMRLASGRMTTRFSRAMPTRDRLLHGSVVTETGCWLWTRARIAKDRYGVLSVNGRQVYAHRTSYEEFVGPIPKGMTIDHLCMNKGCINPDHLEAVTPLANVQRAIRIGFDHPNAPRTCKRGHDWSVTPPRVSTRANGTPKRDCRICAEDRARRRSLA